MRELGFIVAVGMYLAIHIGIPVLLLVALIKFIFA